MAYQSGILKHRVTILNRTEASTGRFGKDGSGVTWTEDGTVWAAVDFVKGLRAMHEGALDVYGVVMIRMRWNSVINMRSRISYDGQFYQILGETFHAVKQENIIQFNAQVLINEPTIVVPTPTTPTTEPTEPEENENSSDNTL